MPSSVELGDDYDAASLRGLAKRCEHPRRTRRLLALAAVYDAMRAGLKWRRSAEGIARRCGIGRTASMPKGQMA